MKYKFLYIDKYIINLINFFRLEYNSAVSRELVRLMKIPIDNYKNILTALKLEHFAPLLDYFDYEGRKLLAIYIITNILENETLIPTLEQVDAVLSMVSPLVQDQLDQPNIEEDPEDFAEEQGLLGRLIHHFKSETADQQYMILSAARKHFSAGGNKRIKYTLPPIVFQAYQLAYTYKGLKDQVSKLLIYYNFQKVDLIVFLCYRMKCGKKNVKKSSNFVMQLLQL